MTAATAPLSSKGLILILGIVLVAVLGLYLLIWGTTAEFAASIDGRFFPTLFPDFIEIYYPMGATVFETNRPVGGYFYSPFFAILLNPVGKLPLSAAMNLWVLIQVATVLMLCAVPVYARWVTRRLLTSAIYFALCLTSIPVLHNFKWGQVSVFLTLAIILSFWAYERGRRSLAATVLAFAAGIKFYPALFAVYFIIRRDLRSCIVFVAATLVWLLLIPFLLLGVNDTIEFYRGTVELFRSQSARLLIDVNSQYFTHALGRIFGLELQGGGHRAMQGMALLISMGSLWLGWRVIRSESRQKSALVLCLLFLSLPFLLKTSWPHYFVYLPLCQVVLGAAALAGGRVRPLLLGPLVVGSIVLSNVGFLLPFERWSDYSSGAFLFVSNLCLLAATYVHVLTPAVRRRNSSGSELPA